MKMTTQRKTLIVGAGISGLLAAQILSETGHLVTILEKSHGVGGRMATRRFENGIFDHGAQFFTVRDPQFQNWVERWLQREKAVEWTRSFSKPGNRPESKGHPRYRGVNGMTAIAGFPAALRRRCGFDDHMNTVCAEMGRNGKYQSEWGVEGQSIRGKIGRGKPP